MARHPVDRALWHIHNLTGLDYGQVFTEEIVPAVEWSPEHLLWAAVLEETFIIVLLGREEIEKHGRIRTHSQTMSAAIYNEAVVWFEAHSTAAGSFEWTCNVLGVDADAIRAEICKPREGPVVRRKRTRG